jgi:hypothetical protein
MDTSKTIDGQCLCGAVTIAIEPKERHFDACHCTMCRRWGGSPAMTINASHAITIQNEDAIGIYGSSDWAERGFCKTCGTHLFWRMRDHSFCTVSAGLFGDLEDFDFTLEIYVDEKPANYSFAGRRKMMTRADVEALFNGDSGR